MTEIALPEITNRIFLIRGHKVMVDEDIARIYGVTTKRLNQQVHRNHERFPSDFMFQLTSEEADSLRLRFATLNKRARPSSEVPPLCLHGAWRCHGFGSPQKPDGHSGEHPYRASVQ